MGIISVNDAYTIWIKALGQDLLVLHYKDPDAMIQLEGQDVLWVPQEQGATIKVELRPEDFAAGWRIREVHSDPGTKRFTTDPKNPGVFEADFKRDVRHDLWTLCALVDPPASVSDYTTTGVVLPTIIVSPPQS